MTRPTLSHPAEYALIKKIYFDNDDFLLNEDIDSIEKLERQESKARNRNKSAR